MTYKLIISKQGKSTILVMCFGKFHKVCTGIRINYQESNLFGKLISGGKG